MSAVFLNAVVDSRLGCPHFRIPVKLLLVQDHYITGTLWTVNVELPFADDGGTSMWVPFDALEDEKGVPYKIEELRQIWRETR